MPRFLVLSCLVSTLLVTQSPSLAQDQSGGFEPPPTFRASEILAQVPETLSGDNFKVREEVPNDGYWDFYTIDTPFGVFQAHGWLDLRTTIREIDAIAELQAISKSEVFAQAAIDKGIEPLEAAAQVITHPVETVKNIPGGIKNMFKRYARRAKKVIDVGKKVVGTDSGEGPGDTRLAEACASGNEPYPGACDEEGYVDDFKKLTRRYFDVDDAIREFHAELGTDPYSSNEVLQNAVRKVSWVGGIGQFGVSKVNPLGKVEAIGIAGRIHKYAWTMDPFELRKELDKIMIENGIAYEERQYFLNNPFMTPTKQAFIILSLEEMDGVEGRTNILHWAADSRNEDEALYSMATVALTAWYHGQNPAIRFLPNTLMPVIETAEGRIVTLMPIDHLSWTEEVATILQAALTREEVQNNANRDIWLMLRASDRAKAELAALGFNVIEDGYKQVLASGEDMEFDDLDAREHASGG